MSVLIRDEIICRNVISTAIESETVTIQDIDVNTFSAPSVISDSYETKSDIINTLSVTDLNIATSVVATDSVEAQQFIIDTFTTPQLNFTNASTDTVSTESSTMTDLTVADGEVENLTASGTITSEQLVATDTSEIEEKLEIRAGPNSAGEYFMSPNEGVFRGICFFKDVDVGIDSPAKISMNMRSVGNVPFLNSYNKFLGAVDSGSNFDGTQAVFSLCTATTPARTLRFQQDGNLAIYSDGTKIWQNGSMVSDARLKENLSPIQSAMEKILKIDGVLFDYTIGDKEKSCGVILEQVREIVPECVVDNLVHLENLVPLLVEGMKELAERNRQIAARAGAHRN